MKGLLFTYVLGYGGAAAALFNPVIGLFVYVLFSIVRPQVMFGWAGDLSGMSQTVGIAMLAGWTINGFGNWQFGRAKPIVISLVAFLAWFGLSAAFAPDQSLAWAMFLERLKVVLPFMVGMTMLDRPVQVRQLAWLIVLAHGYLGFEMNLAYLQGYNRAHEEGLLGDNNSFAISMVSALGPAVFLGFNAERWWQKLLAFSSAAMILHTVQLTFSRGGMLSMVITGIVLLIVMPKRPTYILGVVLMAALAVRLTGPELQRRFMSTFASAEARDGSAQSRLDLWADCLVVMQRHPLVGIGPSHFPRVAHEFGWPAGKQAHSTWMQAGAETGIPSLIFLFSFYAMATFWGLRLSYIAPRSELGQNGMYVFSGLIGFLIAAQFVSMEGLEVPFYVALVVAATLKLRDQYEPRDSAAAITANPAESVSHDRRLIDAGVNPEWERRFSGQA
jgi:O-antigen ligase